MPWLIIRVLTWLARVARPVAVQAFAYFAADIIAAFIRAARKEPGYKKTYDDTLYTLRDQPLRRRLFLELLKDAVTSVAWEAFVIYTRDALRADPSLQDVAADVEIT
jgi:hypothetical protein